jgi:2,3-bisphosphoglycerate-dependent phosphoglycerate mutase
MPGTLVLLRHGESTLNAQGRFTGLLDPSLTAAGRAEAKAAAALIAAARLTPQAVWTSTLARATETARIVLGALGTPHVPQEQAWELNERSYGCLTGLSRAHAMAQLGQARYTQWRRSYHGTPHPMPDEELEALRDTPALAGLPPEAVPATESLNDVVARIRPFWDRRLAPSLRRHRVVLAVAHGNSLRALCLVIDRLAPEEVEALNIPTGQPLVYRFTDRMEPTVRGGTYLDPQRALAGAERIASQGGT